ncbi:hypothetical protein [Streptomyces sp. NBC_00582]|uniref:hypothetical protein n=1 Tax=Streptomyces sp. NBC_00582 TaxID=2975783 RepID=UPI002E81559D|nr:hypothetical protein [Streptomyces sp. NBC_00582]WUB64653.1 hypothetical protein OG852_31745 [Streptomyces sp. NBC_00582]
MSARDVIEHALRVYYADSRNPSATVGRLLAQYDAEQRPANETLVKAREAAADMFEVEAGERRPMWRVIYTDSESPTGVALVCTADGVDDVHHLIDDGPDGPVRDEQGVYDCCPDTQFETYSTALAAYLVELLNADTEDGAA